MDKNLFLKHAACDGLVTVRAMTADDRDALETMFADAALDYPSIKHFGDTTTEQSNQFTAYAENGWQAGSTSGCFVFSVLQGQAHDFAGFVTYNYDFPRPDFDEIGLVIAPGFRKQRVGFRACKLVMEHALALRQNKIMAVVEEGNVPALRLFNELGFHDTGDIMPPEETQMVDAAGRPVAALMLRYD